MAHPLRTSETVFLGVVVQPKTKAPIYVTRRSGSQMTVDIIGLANMQQEDAPARAYVALGDGYLNDDREYAGPTDVTGLPRSHTPRGVSARGGGYGTCLYTGLVLLASAQEEGKLFVPGIIGSGAGISSESSTRSDSATRWWRAALARGIAAQEKGDTEGDDDEERYETEELDDEDVEDHVSSRDWRRLTDQISDAISNYGEWSLAGGVSIRANLSREVPVEGGRSGEVITADFYTLASAEKHHLVAVREIATGGIMTWARKPTFDGVSHKDVILALNVTGQDSLMVAKLALVAKEGGASDAAVSEMMMRNQFGADIISRKMLFQPGEQVELPVVDERLGQQLGGRRRTRMPPARERGQTAPPHTNPAPIPVTHRNPAVEPTASERRALEKSLAELEKRRADLGWNELEDLP